MAVEAVFYSDVGAAALPATTTAAASVAEAMCMEAAAALEASVAEVEDVGAAAVLEA
jgi:hypothetical protein